MKLIKAATTTCFLAAMAALVEPANLKAGPMVLEMRQAPVMAIQTTGNEVQLAEPVTPPPAWTEVATAAPNTEGALAATASPLPRMALFRLLAWSGFLAPRFIRVAVRVRT